MSRYQGHDDDDDDDEAAVDRKERDGRKEMGRRRLFDWSRLAQRSHLKVSLGRVGKGSSELLVVLEVLVGR